jgi:hypothetical protein
MEVAAFVLQGGCGHARHTRRRRPVVEVVYQRANGVGLALHDHLHAPAIGPIQHVALETKVSGHRSRPGAKAHPLYAASDHHAHAVWIPAVHCMPPFPPSPHEHTTP